MDFRTGRGGVSVCESVRVAFRPDEMRRKCEDGIAIAIDPRTHLESLALAKSLRGDLTCVSDDRDAICSGNAYGNANDGNPLTHTL